MSLAKRTSGRLLLLAATLIARLMSLQVLGLTLEDIAPAYIEAARADVLSAFDVDQTAAIAAIQDRPYTTQLSLSGTVLYEAAYSILEAGKISPTPENIATLASIENPLRPNADTLQPDSPLVAPEPGVCPWTDYFCPSGDLYRTVDGSCNNREHPLWGRTAVPFRRALRPMYYGPQALPNARLVSFSTCPDKDVPNTIHTDLLTEFGQFLDHDVTRTPHYSRPVDGSSIDCGLEGCDLNNKACIPITIPLNDPFFKDKPCLKLTASTRVPNPKCTFGYGENLNSITAFIDASAVYGETQAVLKGLRDPEITRGRMLVAEHPSGLKQLLPADQHDGACAAMDPNQSCFKAGDTRVNIQPILTIQHTLWVRLHNVIEANLFRLNPNWTGEHLFQETRKIVGALLQHVTYKEFLPAILGLENVKLYNLVPLKRGYFTGYDAKVNAGVTNSFAAAAYRFGHSMIKNKMKRLDEAFKPTKTEPEIPLAGAFFRSKYIKDYSIDSYIRGSVTYQSQKADSSVAHALSQHLFTTSPPGGIGTDLVALNIQRGRDHGLPGYIAFRKLCKLPTSSDFAKLSDLPRNVRDRFASLYKRTKDIDLFVAGISEIHRRDSLVGPTFACMLGRQFRDFKLGDRFWYENDGPQAFTPAQLQEIRKMSLSKILCSMGDDVKSIQPRAFLMPTVEGNNRVPCGNLPRIDFSKWSPAP